jgi:uncharacterized protein with von Willebrand factor type A (vWA) domain
MLRKLLAGVMMMHSVWAADIAMLVDTSGSMKGNEEALVRLIDRAWTYQYDIRIFSFADDIRPLRREKPYDIRIGGTTNLSGAIDSVIEQVSPNVLVIMTDGAPNSNDNVRRAVSNVRREKKLKICSVYVGAGKVPEILSEISDVVLQEAAIDMSLDRCMRQPSIRAVLPQAPEVESVNPYEI